VKQKPKKRSNKNIEVAFGNNNVTKYDIMTSIAKKYTIYEATVWLNTPIKSSKDKTPAELMLEGKFKEVQSLIEESDELSQ